MRPKTTKQPMPTAFRLPSELLRKLDEHAKRLERRNPGLTFSRTDAMRELLTRAIEVAEKEEAR